MSCHFHFLVARHPADAIKVLMHATPAGQQEDELVLIASPEAQCALSLGLPALPSGGGLAGLLHGDVGQLVVPLRETGTRFYAIFPSAAEAGRRSYAELLDLARFQLSSPVPVKVVVEYARLRVDLPPMYADDELTCFWEVRDLLADEDSAAFMFLSERVETSNRASTGCAFTRATRGPPAASMNAPWPSRACAACVRTAGRWRRFDGGIIPFARGHFALTCGAVFPPA